MAESDTVGFNRPMTEPLLATVKFYQRHVFACTGQTNWPAHIIDAGGFLGALATAIEAQANSLPQVIKLTACDEPSRGSGHDMLVFPDALRFLDLREAEVPRFVNEFLAASRVPDGLRTEPVVGWHIFVCAHGARDARCGFCGPHLRQLFARELSARGLLETVGLSVTSHVGGHQFAGNVLIYPHGDWYGYVTPRDVPRIIDQHILGGQIVADLWRGRMGLTKDEQIQAGSRRR